MSKLQNWRIEKRNELTEGEKARIKELEALSLKPENLHNYCFLSGELNADPKLPCFYLGYEGERLVAFLTVFFPGWEEGELNAFTHPDYRKKGCFTALFREAASDLQRSGVGRLVLCTEPESVGGQLARRFPQVEFLRSELRMQHLPQTVSPLAPGLEVVPLREENKERYAELCESALQKADAVLHSSDRDGFLLLEGETPVGVFDLEYDGSTIFLCSVRVDPEKRRKGLGSEIVRCALREGLRQDLPVILDVDLDNNPALSLYRKLGFSTVFQVDYFALPF